MCQALSHIPFFAMLIGVIVRTVLIFILVSKININMFGGIIANIVFLSISTIILAIIVTRYVVLEYSMYNNLIKPLIMGFVSLAITYFVHWLLKVYMNYFLSMVISAIIGISFYLFCVYFGKVFSYKELKILSLKKSKLSKIKDK